VANARRERQAIREILPGLKRVALLFDSSDAGAMLEVNTLIASARSANLTTRSFPIRKSEDLDAALSAIVSYRPESLVVVQNPLTSQHRERLSRFVLLQRVPLLCESREFADAGALLTYGPNSADLYRRAAGYVDRILKGAKPSDLPIEQPTEFDLVVNLRTAHALRLSIPRSILLRASEVIRRYARSHSGGISSPALRRPSASC
jgi:putative ABC transport system substrate-binding protein